MSSALAASVPARVKSPEAFRTISEASLELDVPQHVLRFWETRFAQVRPVKRAGGRRFYRPEDVALLRGIRSLLYSDGYTIKGVQKVLRDKGWRFVADIGRKAIGDVAWAELAAKGTVDETGPSEGEVRSVETPMAVLRRAYADASDTVAMEEHKRVKLELLLAELLVLRDRLRTTRARSL